MITNFGTPRPQSDFRLEIRIDCWILFLHANIFAPTFIAVHDV